MHSRRARGARTRLRSPSVAQSPSAGVSLRPGREFAIKFSEPGPSRRKIELRAGGGEHPVVHDLRAVDRERSARQSLKRSTERRVADKVVRPRCAAKQDQRLTPKISVGSSKRAPSSVRTSAKRVGGEEIETSSAIGRSGRSDNSWKMQTMPAAAAAAGFANRPKTLSKRSLTGVGRNNASDDLDQSRFARAIFPKHRMNGAAVAIEIDILERANAAVPFRNS